MQDRQGNSLFFCWQAKMKESLLENEEKTTSLYIKTIRY